jgi:hypothetical protein
MTETATTTRDPALAAVAELRELQTPAPIDIAPQVDGALLLLFDPKYTWSIGYWSDDSAAWWVEDCGTRLKPTHWAPLPADPRPSAADTA